MPLFRDGQLSLTAAGIRSGDTRLKAPRACRKSVTDTIAQFGAGTASDDRAPAGESGTAPCSAVPSAPSKQTTVPESVCTAFDVAVKKRRGSDGGDAGSFAVGSGGRAGKGPRRRSRSEPPRRKVHAAKETSVQSSEVLLTSPVGCAPPSLRVDTPVPLWRPHCTPGIQEVCYTAFRAPATSETINICYFGKGIEPCLFISFAATVLWQQSQAPRM
jgi:hypothetical protein